MVGGVDRYYQIARCLRDEDLRADRQFEFMQLDAEMSFVDQEDVFTAIGHAVANAAEAVTGERPTEFARMTWLEAQERYGSDKPDTRFGMELVELTPIFEGTEARVFQAPCVKGIRMEGGVDALSRNQIDALVETCQRWGARSCVDEGHRRRVGAGPRCRRRQVPVGRRVVTGHRRTRGPTRRHGLPRR